MATVTRSRAMATAEVQARRERSMPEVAVLQHVERMRASGTDEAPVDAERDEPVGDANGVHDREEVGLVPGQPSRCRRRENKQRAGCKKGQNCGANPVPHPEAAG